MNHSNSSYPSRVARALSGLLFAALLAGGACSRAQNQEITGETHFLRRCDPNANDCGTGLTCVCGVCTRECGVSADCSAYPTADCIGSSAAPGALACEATPAAAARCDVSCGSDADCRTLSENHRCERGFCRIGDGAGGTGGSAGSAGSGATGGGGTGGDAAGEGGEGGEAGCVRGAISGNEVVVLGDTFMALTHQITAEVEELSRAAGSLPAGQRYRDESTVLNNALAFGGNGIAAQYGRATAEANVAVVIMNGGGADVLGAVCEAQSETSCPTLTAAAAAATTLFEQMASDGVSHVVYAFYPDPVDVTVRERMNVLRTLVRTACEQSPVPCHFLDLRPAFEGRYAEFIMPDGLNPTAAGAEAAAAAIWATMQENCVAQ